MSTTQDWITALSDSAMMGRASATDIMGLITQGQYENWRNTYYPMQLAALNMTTYANPGIVNAEVDKGMTTANTTASALQGQAQRNFARYGLSPNAAQQQAIDRSVALSRSASVVDAANRIRQNLSSRNNAIMTGLTI